MFEVEICAQNFYRKALENNALQGSKGTRIGQREKLRCKAAVAESSADFTSFWSWAGLPEVILYQEQGVSHCSPLSANHGMLAAPGEEAQAFRREFSPAQGHAQRRTQLWVTCRSRNLREWMLVLKGSRTVPLYSGPNCLTPGQISWKRIFPWARVREDGFSMIQAHWVDRALYF